MLTGCWSANSLPFSLTALMVKICGGRPMRSAASIWSLLGASAFVRSMSSALLDHVPAVVEKRKGWVALVINRGEDVAANGGEGLDEVAVVCRAAQDLDLIGR